MQLVVFVATRTFSDRSKFSLQLDIFLLTRTFTCNSNFFLQLETRLFSSRNTRLDDKKRSRVRPIIAITRNTYVLSMLYNEMFDVYNK